MGKGTAMVGIPRSWSFWTRGSKSDAPVKNPGMRMAALRLGRFSMLLDIPFVGEERAVMEWKRENRRMKYVWIDTILGILRLKIIIKINNNN